MTKAEKEALWAQDRAMQQLSGHPTTAAHLLATQSAALARAGALYGLPPSSAAAAPPFTPQQLAAAMGAAGGFGGLQGMMPRTMSAGALSYLNANPLAAAAAAAVAQQQHAHAHAAAAAAQHQHQHAAASLSAAAAAAFQSSAHGMGLSRAGSLGSIPGLGGGAHHQHYNLGRLSTGYGSGVLSQQVGAVCCVLCGVG